MFAPGIWLVTYSDDNFDGLSTGKWCLTHHPTKTNQFNVERELKDGSYGHIMGDGELHVSPLSGEWSMRTFLSFVRVVEYKRVA